MHSVYYAVGWLLLMASARGRFHDKLFTSRPAFAAHPFPTIPMGSPALGPSGSYFDKDHTADGEGYFPALSWPSTTEDTKEYLLVCEEPDAAIPEHTIRGIYYGIPSVFTGLQHPDFLIKGNPCNPYLLRGGFKYGDNRNESVYHPPDPPVGSGLHRYFFELIALNQTLDRENFSDKATLEEISKEVEGKVASWGEWVGVYGRA